MREAWVRARDGSILVRHQPDRLLHLAYLRVRHEGTPDQAGAAVLDHHRLRCLVEADRDAGIPVELLVERVPETVDAPQLGTEVPVPVLDRRS